jgi:hypothetical protein
VVEEGQAVIIQPTKTWVDRVILAIAEFHDDSALWKHLRLDPDAFREAVRHALGELFSACTYLSVTQRQELALVPDVLRRVQQEMTGESSESLSVAIGAIEQVLSSAKAIAEASLQFTSPEESRGQSMGTTGSSDRHSKKGNGTMTDEFVENKRVATSLESNGLHAAKKKSPSVISTQLRDELIRILRMGDDTNEGAFTVAIAAHVEKFAIAAREILMTENLAQNDLASLMMMRNRHLGGAYPYLGSSFGPETGMSLLPSVNNENFGVQAIRQVVDAARTMSETPAKLVEALVIARSNNLTDVAASLEKKLGVSKNPDVVEPQGPLQ